VTWRVGLLAACLSAVQADAQSGVSGADSVLLVERVRTAETRFLADWRRLWLGSYDEGYFAPARLGAVHCHYDNSYDHPAVHIIRSWFSRRSMCPVWYTAGVPDSDERTGIDASLSDDARTRARWARADLLRVMDSAASLIPGDRFIAGQRVRMLIDQRELDRADAATRACGPRPWCGMLAGLVWYARGDLARADSTFARAMAAFPDAERCERSDLSVLIPPGDRDAYNRVPCEARGPFVERFWWLADPLWADHPVNDRRAEHMARWVTVELRRALTIDERWDWVDDHGGDAIAEMLLRYGWPTVVGWGGTKEDEGHFNWLGFSDSSVNVSAEYAGRRNHTVPRPSQLDPAAMARYTDPDIAPARTTRAPFFDTDWWAVEHYARTGAPIVGLTHQRALFRRASQALIEIAAAFPDVERREQRGELQPALIISRGPSEFQTTAGRLRTDTALRMTAFMAPGAAVVSVEAVPRAASVVAGRARFGVDAPGGLAGWGGARRDSLAVSDLLLFAPHGSSDSLPGTVEDAAAAMLTTEGVARGQRLGLFWEMYGVGPGDTVNVALRITRTDRPGFMARLGARLGIGDPAEGSVAVRWQEPQPRRAGSSMVIAGVPVQGRSVVIDMGRTDRAQYLLELTVERPGGQSVRVTRPLAVR
jgi:hypothetical protein